MPLWKPFNNKKVPKTEKQHNSVSTDDLENNDRKPPKWSLGILQDTETDEVPGSILLLSKAAKRNEPLGLRHAPARTSSSSLPSPYPPSVRSRSRTPTRAEKKKTPDGKVILEPQPDDSRNDPLNWPVWRRNAALLSLGFYCMVGGGMTPILAAGFNDVSATYHISVSRVALSVGLYMMGLGVGCVIMSPTAILFGKRPVYLLSCILFILSSVWCALSPNFTSLLIARIFQGIAVSPVECLPSATIAEIFFLHERAYRLGIYTLLLLGGKNLIPLVSAVIIQSLGWRWVFWMVAIVLGFGGFLLFLFVGETFWDRTPRPKHVTRPGSSSHLHLPHRPHFFRTQSAVSGRNTTSDGVGVETGDGAGDPQNPLPNLRLTGSKKHGQHHVAFEQGSIEDRLSADAERGAQSSTGTGRANLPKLNMPLSASKVSTPKAQSTVGTPLSSWKSPTDWDIVDDSLAAAGNTPDLHNLNSPWYVEKANEGGDYFAATSGIDAGKPPTADVSPTSSPREFAVAQDIPSTPAPVLRLPNKKKPDTEDLTKHVNSAELSESTAGPDVVSNNENTLDDKKSSSELPAQSSKSEENCAPSAPDGSNANLPAGIKYTEHYRTAPPKNWRGALGIYTGRLSNDSWFRVAWRPFVLFCYPSILWSAMVYALSVGWLIVLSESVTIIYKNRESYNFDSLQVGLVYLSPFIGGVLGTAVAGKVSDIIVRFMARKNDGVYEPEFRLVMAFPIAVTSVIGLMGFGWSAAERDNWFVPTFFFGVISFGCSLGSTTAITFAVDSYRQYAGEALVTLNFTKNIFHGLVFSLFFTHWLESDGSKKVFLALGGIQLACLFLTIPMYIYGKRCRMWTVRRNLMERF